MFIETGPHKHAIQQTFFLYVYEPGGNRIELCNAGARLVLAPDWQPINWTEAERAKGQAWGLQDHRVVPHPRHAARGGPDHAGSDMIIDCHGHYTTAPAAHTAWRDAQRAAFEAGTRPRRPTRRSPTTRSARRSRPASCA